MSLTTMGDLIMFSPLPPKPNGIADYSRELLAGLKSKYRCTVVVEDHAERAVAPAGVTVISESEYLRFETYFRRMMHVYQVGNNSDHIYMLPYITERPGILVLHDPSLHHLMNCVSANIGNFSRYVNALEAEHGAAGRVLGEQFRRYQVRDTAIFYDMPMTGGLVGPSLGTIVHSRYAQAKVLARVPEAIVTVVPHQYLPPDWSEIESPESLRQRFGVNEGEILFVSLGFVTKQKRVDLALRALAAIRDRLPPFKYIISGELQRFEIDIPALVSDLGLTDCVMTTGYLAEEDFFALVGAADVVINLRHPIGGETSGTMIRALGAGACVVVVDRGPFTEIPEGAAIRLPWGRDFLPRLAEALLRLGNDGDLRHRVGRNARRFTAMNNSIHATVRGYQKAIDQAIGRAPPRWNSAAAGEFLSLQELTRVNRDAAKTYANPVLPCWFSAGIMPICSGGVRTLWIGDPGEHALLVHLGYPLDAVMVLASADEAALAGQSRRSFDLIMLRMSGPTSEFVVLDQHLAVLNRLLAFGGLLILVSALSQIDGTTPLIRSIVLSAASDQGFHVDAYATGGAPDIFAPPNNSSAEDAQEQRCWRLRKVSETVLGGPIRHNADVHCS